MLPTGGMLLCQFISGWVFLCEPLLRPTHGANCRLICGLFPSFIYELILWFICELTLWLIRELIFKFTCGLFLSFICEFVLQFIYKLALHFICGIVCQFPLTLIPNMTSAVRDILWVGHLGAQLI